MVGIDAHILMIAPSLRYLGRANNSTLFQRSHSNSNPVKGISRLKLALLMLDFDISCYTVSIEMESEDFLKQRRTTNGCGHPHGFCVAEFCEQQLALREESWSKWLFTQIFTNLKLCPSKIALVEEIGDARCVTYDELVDGVMRTVNFLSHHRVENNTYVAICMENSIEYIIYELALHFIGAIPILLNPEHVASNRIDRLECSAIVVDSEYYGYILKAIDNWMTLQQIFVLVEDISTISIPRHICIYDGFGYLDFPNKFRTLIDQQCSEVIAFTTSGTSSLKCKIATHTLHSTQLMCTNYLDQLFNLLKQKCPEHNSEKGVNLITSGLYTVTAWSYLFYSLVKGQTAILIESDVWRISFLDKIANLVEQYQIHMIVSHTELLNCIVKYDMHNLYDISSLKIIAYSGSSLSPSIAHTIHQITGATIVQAYSSTEFGVASYAELTLPDGAILTCGEPLSDIDIKITDLEADVEKATGEWGRIMIRGKILFSKYLNSPKNCFTKDGWYRTDDYGMIDGENRLFVGGPVEDIININGIMILPSVLENVLISHTSIKDIAIAKLHDELTAGIVLKENEHLPSVEDLIGILKGCGMDNIPLNRIVLVNCIPRSGTGKLIRSDILFLLKSEDSFVENESSL